MRYQATYYQINVDDSSFEDAFNRQVWFMINDTYGRYQILMFYDNIYNQANGDDL